MPKLNKEFGHPNFNYSQLSFSQVLPVTLIGPIDITVIVIKMRIIIFTIVIWGGKSSVLWSEISFYGDATIKPTVYFP